jgi:hypothetical protein
VSNVVVREKFVPPEGAPVSPTPIAEEALNRFPGVREHYAERDVLAALENVPVIITIAARAGWAALAQDISDATESGRLLLADWWRHGWSETFQRPAFWVAPESPPAPEAHPYPVPAPVAEVEVPVHWTPEEPDQPACDADVDAPADTDMLGSLSLSKVTCRACQQVAIDEAPAPVVAEPVPEPAADEAPATDSVTVLQADAEEAAKEPDATQVIAVTDAPTEAVPVVKTDGGESDDA